MSKTKKNGDIANVIHRFAEKDIHIEVLCDAYKLNMSVCYRGYVTYKDGDSWIAEDMGCYGGDWMEAFNSCVEYATEISGV